MPMKIVFIENLRLRWSPVGKILRHLKEIRRHTQQLRAGLVALKSVDGMWARDFGTESPYKHLTDAYEQSIASYEKEMEELRKAIESAIKRQTEDEKKGR